MIVTAKVSEVNVTDSDGMPITNGSTIPVNSSLVCSTRYDYKYNFTFSWTTLYSRPTKVVAGQTQILRNNGSFAYRCTIKNYAVYGYRKKQCTTSRIIYGNASYLGTV